LKIDRKLWSYWITRYFSGLLAVKLVAYIGWPSTTDPKGGYLSFQRRIQQDLKKIVAKLLIFRKKNQIKI
jgi:hypothetical protein